MCDEFGRDVRQDYKRCMGGVGLPTPLTQEAYDREVERVRECIKAQSKQGKLA
jgi:hypothetical protein